MLLKIRISNGRPAPRAMIKRLIRSMRRDLRGSLYRRKEPNSVRLPSVYQDREARRFLNWRRAAACCLSAEIIFLRQNPSRSTLLEEAAHALQFHLGIYNDAVDIGGNLLADVAMEYMAASVLHQHAERWKLPAVEKNDTSARLRRFRSAARRHGGLTWDLRLKSRRSAKCLVRKLESWMGKSSMDG